MGSEENEKLRLMVLENEPILLGPRGERIKAGLVKAVERGTVLLNLYILNSHQTFFLANNFIDKHFPNSSLWTTWLATCSHGILRTRKFGHPNVHCLLGDLCVYTYNKEILPVAKWIFLQMLWILEFHFDLRVMACGVQCGKSWHRYMLSVTKI